jgi:SAM-dependent methyltransferase
MMTDQARFKTEAKGAGDTDEVKVREQYASDRNLRSRINLHAQYSINPTPWAAWVFDQLDLPPGGEVLELGAGPGTLWDTNRSRLGDGCSVVLTDASAGMVRTARETLGDLGDRFAFGVADAQALPFPDGSFGIAIANHMLYHVADRRRALGEIARVLQAEGTLYATTVGEGHMREMWHLLAPMVPDIVTRVGSVTEGFTLERGEVLLGECFGEVERRDYEDALAITEVAPVLGYLESAATMMDVELTEAEWARLAEAIAARIEADGVFRVEKVSGLLMGRT